MPAWALSGGAIGIAALVLWLALRGGMGAPGASAMPEPGGSPSGGGTTSGGSSGGQDNPAGPTPYLSLSGTGLDGYTGTTGSPTETSGGVAASSPTPYSGSGDYASSYQPGTIYSTPGSPTGYSALQPAGVLQPAYIGPSGSFVSPGTYAGYGATPQPVSSPAPQPITSSMVAPPVFNPGPSLTTQVISGGTRAFAV